MYNGHKNYAYWNVALWLANDEGLYNLCRETIRHCRTLDEAARQIVETLKECGAEKTPDGASYSVSAVRAGISRDM